MVIVRSVITSTGTGTTVAIYTTDEVWYSLRTTLSYSASKTVIADLHKFGDLLVIHQHLL